MQEDLRLRNFSEREIRHHTHTVAEFAKFLHESPDPINSVPSMFAHFFCIDSTNASLPWERFRGRDRR
jgi:hypothetical protein